MSTSVLEFGSTGVAHYDGVLDEEWHRDLAGPRGVKFFREMEDNCAVVGAFSAAQEFLVRQVQWRIDPANDEPEAQTDAEFIGECWRDMDSTPDAFLSELMSASIYGWSLFEIVYKVRRGPTQNDARLRSEFDDGRVGWRDFAIRPQDTLARWDLDRSGRTNGMWQSAPPDFDEVLIPMDKALLFRPRSRKSSPEGRSLLRSAARSYRYLKRHQEIEAIGVERNLAGLPDMQIPVECFLPTATAEQKAMRAYFEDVIVKIKRGEYHGIVRPSEQNYEGKPTGFKFGLVTSGGDRPADADIIIKRYESRILVALLAEFLILGMDKHGSFALGDVKTDVFAMALGAILEMVAEVINRYAIPRLCQLNGIPPERYPRLVHGDIETPELTHMANYISQLVGAGILRPTRSLERYALEYGGLPVGDPEHPNPRMSSHSSEEGVHE